MDEMLTRSPSVMLGYWNNPEATAKSTDADGWFHTGDRVRVDEEGHVYIIGRIKEIIVLANGEKVPPGDMEQAIGMDPLFSQVLVLGEAKPYLTALVVLNPTEYKKLADSEGLSDLAAKKTGERMEKIPVERIADELKDFPGYAKIPRVAVMDQPWTVESGMMTPTLKLKRGKILKTMVPMSIGSMRAIEGRALRVERPVSAAESRRRAGCGSPNHDPESWWAVVDDESLPPAESDIGGFGRPSHLESDAPRDSCAQPTTVAPRPGRPRDTGLGTQRSSMPGSCPLLHRPQRSGGLPKLSATYPRRVRRSLACPGATRGRSCDPSLGVRNDAAEGLCCLAARFRRTPTRRQQHELSAAD
jgi:hypothetical protein